MATDHNTTLATLLHPLLSVAGDRVALTDGPERLKYWTSFQQLYEIFPYKNVKYGEIYNRYMIGNILFILARAKQADLEAAATTTDEEEEPVPPSLSEAVEGFPAAVPLDSWKEDDWDMFAGYLTAIAENLQRKDADADPAIDPEDAELDEERSEHELFTVKMEKITRYIKVYKAICPLREKLMEQINNEETGDEEYPKIHKKSVEKLWKRALEEEDDAVRSQLIRKLFEEKEKEDTSFGAPCLRTIGELRKVFNQKPLTFDKFDDRVEVLMAEWVEVFFEEPRLLPFYFPDGVGEQSEDALMRLREARHQLKHEGEDPLEESLRLANTLSAGHSASPNRGRAPGSHSRRRVGSSMYKKRKTATRLEFEDGSQEEEVNSDDPNGDGTYHLSRLPRRGAVPGDNEESDEESFNPNKKKARKSQEKKYQGKRPWSEEEKKAIIEGIRTIGLSKWAKIKEKYDVLFNLRTSSQIKDCFRTMKRKGEIPAEFLGEENEN